jgi:GNAT superfamily N-acetyltransferase
MELRPLRPADDRSKFRSGDPDLDSFFEKFAGQNQFRHHLGTTYVAAEDGIFRGFATVSPGHVEVGQLPPDSRIKVPRYPLPVLRLARLAVDRMAQGQGLGATLFRFVLQMSIKMASDYGCVGVVVDAKPEALEFYLKFGFVRIELVEGRSDARPSPTALFLSLRAIKKALLTGPA